MAADGFFDLMACARQDTSPQTDSSSSSITLSSLSRSSATKSSIVVVDEEAVYNRTTAGVATKTPVQAIPQRALRPVIQYESPHERVYSDEIKSSQRIRRRELLDRINRFLATCGLGSVHRRDPLWKDWFLGSYLKASNTDRALANSVLLLDKRPADGYREAITRLYEKLNTPPAVVVQQPAGKRPRPAPESAVAQPESRPVVYPQTALIKAQ
jgi:hypothetical protein